MKQYLLLLKSGDFTKSGNIWVSRPINLYANSQYLNYSYVRSPYGLDLIGDRTFVGTEVTSPSTTGLHATPLVDRAVYTTNFGEIVSEEATPSILRFVDTSSRIDVLSYRHVFTNVSGDARPGFSMQMYESDSETGPWLKSIVANESNTIFNQNCKQFIKLELELSTDGLDPNELGLVFYLEIGIYDPASPVTSKSTREILRRFPSWTKLYEDSVPGATPALDAPQSTGGKFLNALVQEHLDNTETQIDLYSINSFISTADVNQLAWAYISTGIAPNIVTITGDGIPLAHVSTISDFFASRTTDYIFYYNPIDRELITLRKFNSLKINDDFVDQEPLNIFNDFDEFGARVGLPRLYLESNQNYKLRILDVMVNPPSPSMDGFKRTIRRELDLWRAYGTTPDSSFGGATPIVLEISDLEKSTPYFSSAGVAEAPFKTFVDSLNERYPANLGYVRWNETVWDYGGLELEGLGRVSAQYDVDYSDMPEYQQNGVGDLDDFKLSLEPVDRQFADSLPEYSITDLIPLDQREYINGGSGEGRLQVQGGSADGLDASDPTLLIHDGENYMYWTGVSGNYASVPDAAALDITGDIEFVRRIALDDWTPDTQNVILSKRSGVSSQISYQIAIETDGRISFTYSTNGTTAVTRTSTESLFATNKKAYWLKVAVDVNNGASGHSVYFYSAPDSTNEPTSWTPVGPTVTTAGTISLYSGTAPINTSGYALGTLNRMTGKDFRCIIRSGIGGTKVLDIDFTKGIVTGGESTFTAITGQTVTINRSTASSGRKAIGVVQNMLSFADNDYIKVADDDLLNFNTDESMTMIISMRKWGNIGSSEGYIGKMPVFTGGGNGAQGYAIGSSSTQGDVVYHFTDGWANGGDYVTNKWTYGQKMMLWMTADRSTQIVTVGQGAQYTQKVTEVAEIISPADFYIGRIETFYANMEFFGAALWRRALTIAEIGLVNDHYDGNQTAESEELLREAVLWIDPKLKSSAKYNFGGTVEISGISTETELTNLPVVVDYQWYARYRRMVPDYENSKVRPSFVVEVIMPPSSRGYRVAATPTTFYYNFSYQDDPELIVGNNYSKNHSASPEFRLVRLFDQDGLSLYTFRNKRDNKEYTYNNNAVGATPDSNKINILEALNVKVIFNKKWNHVTQTYEEILGDPFRFSFNTATPLWVIAPSPAVGSATASYSIASPNIEWYNSNIRIGSSLYPTKSQSFASDIFNGTVILNGINKATVTQAATINTAELTQFIVYPRDATPDSIYINTLSPSGAAFYGTTIGGVPGGYAFDPQLEVNHLIPSSPNVTFRPYSNAGPLSTPNVFDAATINYSSTPAYLEINTAAGQYYPIPQTRYRLFSIQSTPNTYYGYVDNTNNVYKDSSEVEKILFGKDTLLENLILTPQSFNLDSSKKYDIRDVSFKTTPDAVEVYVKNVDGVLTSLNEMAVNQIPSNLTLHAQRQGLPEAFKLSINQGWAYFDDEEYYLFGDPKTQTATGRYFSIPLSQAPRKGAPVVVEVGATPYRHVVFEDSATPGKFSFVNSERVKGNFTNELFLAYEDVSDIIIRDTYIDTVLFTGLSTQSNIIKPFSHATPVVQDREYEISYRVNNAYHIEKDIFNDTTNTYRTTLHFSTTPSSTQVYNVIYEALDIIRPNDLDVDVTQLENPLDEGFIYASLTDYEFSYVEHYLSPGSIADSPKDYMSLVLISYDKNGNLKPGQTFSITGTHVAATPRYVTTNENGFGNTIVRYNGSIPATVKTSSINIEGMGSATPNAGPNSSAQGYTVNVPFKINRNVEFNLNVRAVPYRYSIDADGISNNAIIGQVYWKGLPLEGQLTLRWAKARTLKDLFTRTESYESGGNVITNSNGSFEISNTIISQDSDDPGFWFAEVEIESSNQVIALLQQKGEAISINDVTITGDIVYWSEEYDNLNYFEGVTNQPNVFRFAKQIGADMIATPGFVYRHFDQNSIIKTSSTPNWLPPRWVPLRKYDQYQLQLLGATPNDISVFSSIHPDSKED